jgi:hypothetical protein
MLTSFAQPVSFLSQATNLTHESGFLAWFEGVSPFTSVRSADPGSLPRLFALQQNYPNPFNPSTRISFDLPFRSRVILKIYDVLGREVRTLIEGFLDPGTHDLPWDGLGSTGKGVGTGAYFYRLEAVPESGGTPSVQVRRMLLLK